MTETPPPPGPTEWPTDGPTEGPDDGPTEDTDVPPGPRATSAEIRDLGRLRRSTHDRKVAGVAAGLARHLDVDPVIIRVAFVVLTFFGGAGLIAYGAGWLLLPQDDGSEAVIDLEDRNRVVVLALVGVVAAASIVAELADTAWGPFWFPWQLVVLAVVAVVLLSRRERGPRDPRPPSTPAYAAPPAYAASPAGPLAPPVTAPVTAPPAPRNPRRRGPVLFWFTLALVVLAEGVLGTLDLAGVPVADSAYPALALGLIGLMLVVGAFFGRAGGLILVGLLSVPVLGISTAAGEIDPDPVREAPTAAASVDETYRLGLGELVLDLTEVRDLDALDGRTVTLSVDVGSLQVIVPEGLSVEASAVVHGPGEITLFGEQRGGIDTAATESSDAGADAPVLTLDLDADLGEIVVRTR